MNYRIIFFYLSIFFVYGCELSNKNKSSNIYFTPKNNYENSGFALIYNSDFNDIKKLEDRSLEIYHKSLNKRSKVKILNPINGKYLIAEVKSNKVRFSSFYNSVLSLRIAQELELDFKEPYIKMVLISKDSVFVAKKSKMFEEERIVVVPNPTTADADDDFGFTTTVTNFADSKTYNQTTDSDE